jgi:GNAT superfamily N-acetyltransferase
MTGSLTSVPDDMLATVVTSLEMTARPRPAPLPSAPLRLVRWPAPPSERYRALFRRVGEPWLWFSRLVLPEADLRALLDDPAIEVHAVADRTGIEVGMVELDFRTAGTCQLAYFGLVPELTGKGLGRWLMASTLALAWRPGVTRLGVHTCTLDHPSALGFYRRSGFVAVRRFVETFADPRASGLLSPDAAPQIPLLAPPQRR